MGPKSKKLKISMKDLLEKQGNEDAKTEADQHLGDIQNDVPNFENKDIDENSKKSEKSNQDSKKNPKKKAQGEAKKEVSLKSMIKQATNVIFEERKNSIFLHAAVQAISAENSSIRLINLFQAIHANYSKIFDIFKTNGHQEMEMTLSRFSTRLSDVLKEQRETKQVQISSKKNDTKEDYSSKWIQYYNMQLKLKDDEIKRKKAFRDNARGKFNTEIQMIQSFITKNAKIISEIVLRERFQAVINKMAIVNNEFVAKKAKQSERDQKFFFEEMRKMKQEGIMKEKVRRAAKMEKMEYCRKVLAEKFPNLMGVLITPFTIFERVK